MIRIRSAVVAALSLATIASATAFVAPAYAAATATVTADVTHKHHDFPMPPGGCPPGSWHIPGTNLCRR